MSTVSAVVIAENEGERIEACLRALSFCDEVILVDGGSKDRTVELARPLVTKVIEHSAAEHGLNYNKNLGAEAASSEWVLSIDADEIVSPELAAEIKRVIAAPEMGSEQGSEQESEQESELGSDCYRVARKTYLLNHWVKCCNWWPGYVIRLYRKDATKWPPGVHEVPACAGPVGTLKEPLDHYSYPDLGRYILKMEHFTRTEAREKYERGVRLTPGNAPKNLFAKPVVSFLRKYFGQGGWREGIPGFFVSVSAAIAVFMNYIRLWEIQSTGKLPSQGDRG